MLVLQRKIGGAILIGEDVRVSVIEIREGAVKLGIEAPRARRVIREDIADAGERETVREAAKRGHRRGEIFRDDGATTPEGSEE